MTDLFPIVAVPARNEVRRLPDLFAALSAQSWLLADEKVLDVVVVLNNCTDGSAAEVAEATIRHANLAIVPIVVQFDEEHAHVGSARRLAMETALDRCADPARSVLLTTDADAVPPTNWIESNLSHIRDGIDLVGGLIVGDEVEEARLGPDFKRRAELHLGYGRLVDRLASLVDPVAHDPWPRHHDHTGASLAVRAEAYRAVGGMPALPFREDLAFVDRMLAHGFRLRHPLDVSVRVSARLAGRAPGGMADCLKEWMRAAAVGAPLLVEDPKRVLVRLQAKRALREAWVTCAGRDPSPAHRADDGLDAPATMPVEIALDTIRRMIAEAEGNARAA